MIQLLTRFSARGDTAAMSFRDLLLRLKGSVPSEPNNLSYEVYASADDPSTFFCLESWATQEDADRHVTKNDSDGTTKEASALLSGAPETTTIRSLGADQ